MLRPYQTDAITQTRESLKTNRAVVIQMPTGAGKTAVVSEICSLIQKNKKRAWFMVPRTELLQQGSSHLSAWKVPHGIIAPNKNESRAYSVHVVSKDTLIRRYDKIKNHPDVIFIDECHIALDRQKEIAENFPNAKIIGMSATPERLDGRGLSELYDDLIPGPSIPWLMEHGYLSGLRYFAPKIEGLENLHKKGTDVDADELDELLTKRQIYGDAIKYYKKYADGKPALIFCRNVKSAYETAERFSNAGYKFFCIEGKMKDSERRRLLKALKTGEIHGLTNCEIATYGLDIPRVEVGICLRPTMSRALYFQMVGRVLRPSEGKTDAIFLDHVNNVYEHIEPNYPEVPPFFAPSIEWNFHGKDKRKKILCNTCQKSSIKNACKKDTIGRAQRCGEYEPIADISLKMCPECFMYYKGPICKNCGCEAEKRRQAELEEVEAELKEMTPVKLAERPPEERREFVDAINSATREFNEQAKQGHILPGPVGEMLAIAEKLDRNPLWVYHKLTEETRISVNVPLLHEIGRQKGYKPGWARFQQRNLERRTG
jgi:superfamily II DNA or RNA helicase